MNLLIPNENFFFINKLVQIYMLFKENQSYGSKLLGHTALYKAATGVVGRGSWFEYPIDKKMPPRRRAYSVDFGRHANQIIKMGTDVAVASVGEAKFVDFSCMWLDAEFTYKGLDSKGNPRFAFEGFARGDRFVGAYEVKELSNDFSVDPSTGRILESTEVGVSVWYGGFPFKKVVITDRDTVKGCGYESSTVGDWIKHQLSVNSGLIRRDYTQKKELSTTGRRPDDMWAATCLFSIGQSLSQVHKKGSLAPYDREPLWGPTGLMKPWAFEEKPQVSVTVEVYEI